MLAFGLKPQSSLAGQTTLGEAAPVENSKTPIPLCAVP